MNSSVNGSFSSSVNGSFSSSVYVSLNSSVYTSFYSSVNGSVYSSLSRTNIALHIRISVDREKATKERAFWRVGDFG